MAELDTPDAFQQETMPKLGEWTDLVLLIDRFVDTWCIMPDSLIYEAEGKLELAIVSQKEVIAILTTVGGTVYTRL